MVTENNKTKAPRTMTVGNKPRYVSSGKSSFMKDLEVERREKKIKDAEDQRLLEEALYAVDEPSAEDKPADEIWQQIKKSQENFASKETK